MRQETGKMLNYVLEEQVHLNYLEKIIQRDFFPALAQLKQEPSETPVPQMSLNNYLANFKSDENENFTRIVQSDEKEWKDKHWWINHQLVNEEHKQKMLMTSENERQYSRMIEGSRNNNLAITAPAETTNALFFNNDKHHFDDELMRCDKMKTVVFENTRFQESNKPLEYAATKLKRHSDYVLDSKLPSTPLLQGIQDEELKKNEKYQLKGEEEFARPVNKKRIIDEVDGYKVLTMPSPSPAAMQSPLMTYGEVEDTPERLRQYKFPQTPQRDLLLEKLTQKIVSQKKQQKNRKESTVQRLIGTCTPVSSKASSLLMMRLKGSSVRKAPSTVHQPNQPSDPSQVQLQLRNDT